MKRIVFSLVLIFIISVFVHLPFSLIAKYIPPIPHLALANPSGTLWRGAFDSVSWKGKNLGTLSWKLNFFHIFIGKLDVNIDLTGQPNISAKGRAGVSFEGPYAQDVSLVFPSSLIDATISYPFPMNSNGKLTFNIDDYVYSLPWCKSLIGKGRWQDASLDAPFGQLDLGLVSANFSCQSGNLFVKGISRSDSLNTDITLTLSPPNKYKVDGRLTAKDDLPKSIRDQLQWLGQPDSEGRYLLAFSG